MDEGNGVHNASAVSNRTAGADINWHYDTQLALGDKLHDGSAAAAHGNATENSNIGKYFESVKTKLAMCDF